MLEGQGKYHGSVATDGIIMVDGQFAPLHDKIKTAIESISKQPIKYLINSTFMAITPAEMNPSRGTASPSSPKSTSRTDSRRAPVMD